MHLNVSDAVSREHRDNVPIRTIGQADESGRRSVKPAIIARAVRIVRRFLAEDVTKRNFEYHDAK